MGASDIRAGRAFVELGANDTGLEKALKSAGKEVTKFGSEIYDVGKKTLEAGIVINAAIEGTALVFMKMGDDIAKAAERTGMTAEALSTIGFAAGQAGVQFEEFEHAIAKMNKTLYAAAKGGAEANQALQAAGVTFDQLKSKSPEERFKAIATGLSQINDAGQRSGVAMAIFGKSAQQLLPLLNQGAKGIEAFQARARALGLEISTTDADAAEQFHDRLREMLQVLEHTAFVVGSAVAPAIQKMHEKITQIVVQINKWLAQHKPLIEAIRQASVVLIVLGGAITGVGLAIKTAGFALSGFGTVIGTIASAVSFLVSPLGLVVAGIGALGIGMAYFLHQSGALGKSLAYLTDLFPKLKKDGTDAINGITNALTSGQWAVAAQIAWNGLQIEFQRGIAAIAAALSSGAISKAWSDMLTFISRITSPWLAAIGTSWQRIGVIVGEGFSVASRIAIISVSAIMIALENLREVFHLVALSIKPAFADVWKSIKSGFIEMWEALKSSASKYFAGFIEELRHFAAKAKLYGEVARLYIDVTAKGSDFDRVEESLFQEDRKHAMIKAGTAHLADRGKLVTGAEKTPSKLPIDTKPERDKLEADLKAKILGRSAQIDAALANMEAAIKNAAKGLAAAGPGASAKLLELEKEREKFLQQAAKNQIAAALEVKKLRGAGGDFQLAQRQHEIIGSFNPFRFSGAIGASDTPAKESAKTLKDIHQLLKGVLAGDGPYPGPTFA